jgi:hypothetical protein
MYLGLLHRPGDDGAAAWVASGLTGAGLRAAFESSAEFALLAMSDPPLHEDGQGGGELGGLLPEPPPSDHLLHGDGQGGFDSLRLVPDVGAQFSLHGTADLAGLGTFTLTGGVGGTGFIIVGQAQGELTLSNAHGSMVLHLSGPDQPGFSPPPAQFAFEVVSATGAYQDEQGARGTLQLLLTAADGFTLHI